MAKQRFLNNFTSIFIAAVKDAPSSGTPETELDYGVLRISDGAAGSLINPTDGDYYLLTAFKRSGSVESNIEVMRVTGVNNATPGECRITVQRAQEGTSAKAFVAGDYLSLRITKGTAENFSQPADLATKEPVIAAPGSAPTEKYWRGDKTWCDFFTDVRAATLTGLSTATSAAIAATDTVLDALAKLQAQLGDKVDKVSGKGLSTEDYTTAEKTKLAGIGPTLQGDTAPYVTQTKTYQITNYSSFSSYTASASAGTASLVGDTITYTAPATAGSVSLTITADGQPTAFVINVQAAGVAKPTNTSPADGSAGVTDSPTLQSSAFVAFGLTDTHLASRWTVYQGGTQVHSSGWRTDALTSYSVPAGVMVVSTGYTWTVEHRGNALGDSPASTATSFTTAATFNSYIPTPTATPANFGDALEGGFYAGMVWEQLTQSSTNMAIATGSKAFTVPSMTSAPIVYGGQTVEVRSRANPANKFVGTVTGAAGTSLTINVTSVGGSGTFSDWSVMARHRIIVAPKASGEHAGIQLKNANTALPTACQTLTEGFAATQAMRDANTSTVYPAAHWARNLNIGGRTDWYIPARDELELCWRNLKPVTDNNFVAADRSLEASFNYAQNGSYGDTVKTHGTNNNSAPVGAAYTASVPGQTAATAFRSGGAEAFVFGSSYYWSSSDYNATDAWFQHLVTAYPGNQDYYSKTNSYSVRAVRRSVL